MKKLKKSELILISVLFTVLIGYLYYLLFLKGILNDKSMVKEDITAKNQKVEELKMVRKSNKTKEKRYEELQEEVEKYTELITLSDRVPQIAYDLKKDIDSHKLLLKTLKFQEGTSLKKILDSTTTENSSEVFDDIRSVNVNLAIEGDYFDVRDFINTLEKDERLIYINSVTINGKDENSNLADATIELSYFSKNEFEENVDYDFNNGNYGQDNKSN